MSSAAQETCWTLIRAAAAGRRAEREEFTRRYLPAVRAYLSARWRGSPLSHEVDDGVQEVFMACFKPGGALERVDAAPGPGFRAYLVGVVRNVALQLERAGARRSARAGVNSGSVVAELAADDPSLSQAYDRAYARALMREAAGVMARHASESGPPAQRRVELLRLRFEDGTPIREIARLWDADARELHLEYAKAGREFRTALREVVGLSERCAPERLDEECERLLALLR